MHLMDLSLPHHPSVLFNPPPPDRSWQDSNWVALSIFGGKQSDFQPENFRNSSYLRIKQCLKVSAQRFSASGKIAPISVWSFQEKKSTGIQTPNTLEHTNNSQHSWLLYNSPYFKIKVNVSTSPKGKKKKSNKAL